MPTQVVERELACYLTNYCKQPLPSIINTTIIHICMHEHFLAPLRVVFYSSVPVVQDSRNYFLVY